VGGESKKKGSFDEKRGGTRLQNEFRRREPGLDQGKKNDKEMDLTTRKKKGKVKGPRGCSPVLDAKRGNDAQSFAERAETSWNQ